MNLIEETKYVLTNKTGYSVFRLFLMDNEEVPRNGKIIHSSISGLVAIMGFV